MKARWYIAAGGLRAPHGFTRNVASRREGDALVVQGGGIGDRFLDRRSFVRNRRHDGGVHLFHVGHGRLQRVDRGGVLGHGLLLSVGCLLRSGRRSLRIGGRLLRLLQLGVLVGQSGLQAVDLSLQFLAQRLICSSTVGPLGLAAFRAVCFFAGGVASLALAYVLTRLAARSAATAAWSLKFIGPLLFVLQSLFVFSPYRAMRICESTMTHTASSSHFVRLNVPDAGEMNTG